MKCRYRNDLKVEFRAVPFGSFSGNHVLQYRISPNQDLIYEKEYNIFGFKFKLKKKYSTEWIDAVKFLNHPSAYLYDESEIHNHPVFIRDKKELNEYKEKYKTIGEYYDYINEINRKELNDYRDAREKYLSNRVIWN